MNNVLQNVIKIENSLLAIFNKLLLSLFIRAGSLYAQSVQFEVHKGIEGTNDILSVVVPQELRGRSEVVIFLADRPIKGNGISHDYHVHVMCLYQCVCTCTCTIFVPEVVSLDSLLPSCFIELHKQQLMLTPWEQILLYFAQV